MIKTILYCIIYAFLNVSGAALIKLKLKDCVLSTFKEWVYFLFNVQVIIAFVFIFISALVMFKVLSSGSFSFAIPVATGINFIFTLGVGYFIFKDNLNLISLIGFVLILAGILLLSLNNQQHV